MKKRILTLTGRRIGNKLVRQGTPIEKTANDVFLPRPRYHNSGMATIDI